MGQMQQFQHDCVSNTGGTISEMGSGNGRIEQFIGYND